MTPSHARIEEAPARAAQDDSLCAYLVEDNAIIRSNLASALEELLQIRVVGHAETEADAITWMTTPEHRWDLAIVDLFLREGSGYGVLEACAERDTRHKLVVLTNFATIATRTRCAELGADSVFDKSTDLDALFAYCEGLKDEKSGG